MQILLRLIGTSIALALAFSSPQKLVAQLVPGTAPAMPIRGVGVNEGFTNIAGYSMGQATTTTTSAMAAKGLQVVKIWPRVGPAQLAGTFTDPRIRVIIYRPLHLAPTLSECGGTGTPLEEVDYGQIATRLYGLYGAQEKIVILTGWEGDNQIIHYPRGAPTCAWPAPAVVDAYRAILEARQVGVRAARELNASAKLRVYHAVEVKKVPDAPTGGNSVLEKIIPRMLEAPDFVSFSAWGAGPARIATKLNTIETVTQLPRQRIFVGEWGCTTNDPNRAYCLREHANAFFNWGGRLWNVWVYSANGTPGNFDLVNPWTRLDTPNGWSVITPVNTAWAAVNLP